MSPVRPAGYESTTMARGVAPSPTSSVWDLIPDGPTLESVRDASRTCTACPLYRDATQTVFGEGGSTADVVFVGEQPGDQEDRKGRPFVGPAGRLLDEALEQVGIDRSNVYVTNVVKHFKWQPKGKRRIHKKPAAEEIAACRPWLETELDLLKPRVVVCLGATAAQALLGRQFKLTQQRGQWVESELAEWVTATVHPSSILRAPDFREQDMAAFVRDLEKVAQKIAGT